MLKFLLPEKISHLIYKCRKISLFMDAMNVDELINAISQLSADVRDLTKLLRDDFLDSLRRIEVKLREK